MSPLQFASNPSCELCPLSKCGGQSVCIPCGPFKQQEWSSPHDQALLVVGEKPGLEEDKQGANFVGPSGRKLDEFYLYPPEIYQLADIYATNAVRCLPLQNQSPTVGQIKKCSQYLNSDVALLAARYRRVTILCCGAAALRSVLGKRSLVEQAARQAQQITPTNCPDSPILDACRSGNVFCFGTYHPAALMRLPEGPSHEDKVIDVMVGVSEWLRNGDISYEEQPAIEMMPECPPDFSAPVCYDLETFACLKSGRKVSFHPRKMEAIDKVSKGQMIVCASICWRDSADKLHTGYFPWSDTRSAALLKIWLTKATEIWGQNLQYDLKMLRYVCGRHVIPAWRPVRDLLVETFKYNDLQERGLKAVSWLYRIATYKDEKAALLCYENDADPELIKYACKDAWTTYRGIEIATQWQRDKFSQHPVASAKLSPESSQWFSDQVWSAVLMEEAGCGFNIQKIENVEREKKARYDEVISELVSLGVVASGEGKMGSCQQLMEQGIELALAVTKSNHGADSDEYKWTVKVVEELERSDITGVVSIKADNRNLLMGVIPLDDEAAAQCSYKLSLLSEAQSLEKILTAYTGPMLRGKQVDEQVPTKLVLIGAKNKHWDWETNPKTGKAYSSVKRVAMKPDHDRATPIYDRSVALLRSPTNPNYGIIYPSIYILPKPDDEAGAAGGVRGGRWSIKPRLQVLPDEIFDCLMGRWGLPVYKADLSAVEWMMTGYLANDDVILREIADGEDIHSRAASELLGFEIKKNRVTDGVYKWVMSDEGKRVLCSAPPVSMRTEARGAYSTNSHTEESFLIRVAKFLRDDGAKSVVFSENYAGGVAVAQATLRVKAGIERPLAVVERWHRGQRQRYKGRERFREQLIKSVLKDRAIHIPILGVSRSFGGGDDDIRAQRTEIVSPPIQIPSACLMHSSIMGLQQQLTKERAKSKIVLSVHDAMVADPYSAEKEKIAEWMAWHIENNWYRSALQNYYGRMIPLSFEADWLEH